MERGYPRTKKERPQVEDKDSSAFSARDYFYCGLVVSTVVALTSAVSFGFTWLKDKFKGVSNVEKTETDVNQ